MPFHFQFDLSVYRAIFGYAVFQLLFEFINYFSRNLDKLLIGRFLGMASLGYYEKSYRLMMLPLQTLTRTISPVLHPILAQIHDDRQRIFMEFSQVARLLALIGFPLSAFLVFAAPELVRIIFGPQWGESVPAFSILAYSLGLQMVLSASWSVFQASGRTDLLFISGSLSAVLMVGATIVGLTIGSIGAVATALVFACLINFFQGLAILVCGALKQSFQHFLKQLLLPAVAGAVVYLALHLSVKAIDISTLTPISSLVAKAGIAVSAFLVVFIWSDEWRGVIQLVKRR